MTDAPYGTRPVRRRQNRVVFAALAITLAVSTGGILRDAVAEWRCRWERGVHTTFQPHNTEDVCDR